MLKREILSNAGLHVYACAAVALGVINLVWGDFATIWQPIQAFGDHVPGRQILAYLTAIALLVGGAAMLWRRTRQAGVVFVAAVYFVFAVFWLPRVIRFPQIFGTWGGFVEEFFPLTAAVILYVTLSPRRRAWAPTTLKINHYLVGILVISFGIGHFAAIPQTAALVPKWIPPGQQFWAVATGIAFLLAGMSILSGVLDLLASRLLTVMLFVFAAAVWVPRPFAHPRDQTAWAGNAVTLAILATCWVFGDWLAKRHEHLQGQQRLNTVADVTSTRA